MKTCAVCGCKNEYYAKGYCQRHYDRNRTHGNPINPKPKRPDGSGVVTQGYLVIQENKIKKREHIKVIESVLGKSFNAPHTVHHIDGNGLNNDKSNLIACEDNAYHHLLHRRERALNNCGQANWRKCPFCKNYDDPKNMLDRGYSFRHRECINQYNNKLYHQK